MRLGAGALGRATLARQALLERAPLAVPEAVRRLVAVQAQSPPSPYVALRARLAGFDPADLDAAFATGAVVKANAVRMTLHAVHADDHLPFRQATEPSLRADKLGRVVAGGLTVADADALVPGLLAFAASPRRAAECEAWLAERLGGPPGPGVWQGLRQYAPLLHAPTGGPWSFGQRPSYVAPASPPALGDREASDRALVVLVRRYLAAFGPASVADVAQFALVQRSRARAAVGVLSDELERLEGPRGEELWDVPGAPRPDPDGPAPPRLLPMWDSVLLAHADRTRVLPEPYRCVVIRSNGDVLPTLLVGGCVAGVWRTVEGGVEASAFHALDEGAWDGLAAEAASLLAMLADRDPRPYGRYDHWWAKLPSGAEVRVLPGS